MIINEIDNNNSNNKHTFVYKKALNQPRPNIIYKPTTLLVAHFLFSNESATEPRSVT